MKNLMVTRGEKSVWDKPSLSETLANYDRDRWLAAAGGAALTMLGTRKKGFAGGLIAMLGATLTVRAVLGRQDLRVARRWIDRRLIDRGYRPRDIVSGASEESFPASDSPSWTPTAGARG